MLIVLLAAAPALADEAQVKLRDGEGRQLVEANCIACHSLDYIQMNSRFQDRKGWGATVNKMVKVMGAPIRSEDALAIVDYLVRNYGK